MPEHKIRPKSTQLRIKRFFDFTCAALALLVLAPLCLIIAVLIKADTAGPALFTQHRLGRDGTPFKIYKFRTMSHGSEASGSGIYTSSSDPRVTRIGRALRVTSLDELPQFINVLRGEMSIVGPRPPLPHHPMRYAEYPDDWRRRFNMAPGITGLAQVTGRNLLPWPERIAYDVQYVDNWSLRLDLEILAKTALSVVSGAGIFSGRAPN